MKRIFYIYASFVYVYIDGDINFMNIRNLSIRNEIFERSKYLKKKKKKDKRKRTKEEDGDFRNFEFRHRKSKKIHVSTSV